MSNNLKYIVFAGVIILALGGVVFWVMQQNTLPGTPTPSPIAISVTPLPTLAASPSASASANQKVVTLEEQNDSGQPGMATLMEDGGKVKVSLALTATSSAIPQPAHIHVGSCPTPGAVKYPLTNVVNGKSETTLNITMAQLIAQLPLAINVHKSAADIKTYVSCGDLK